VTAPDAHTLPCHHELLLSRGPYHYDDELALLRDHPHRTRWVTKNSGGQMTRPQNWMPRRRLGVAVVMVGPAAAPLAG